MANTAKLNFNPLCHALSIILTFGSFIMLMVVVFNNAPLNHEHSTLEGKMNVLSWLLIVNQSSEAVPSNAFDVRSRLDYNVPRSEVDNTMHITMLGRAGHEEDLIARAGGGLHAYGFGIWGWCEWSDTNWTGYAKCTKNVFWSLPKCAVPSWDSINQVMTDLPEAITKAFSITSFLLLFAPFLVLSFLILLLCCINFEKPYPPWPVPPKSKWPTGKEKDQISSKRTKIAWILRDWRTHSVYFILMLVFLLPSVVTVLIGKSEVNGQGGLKADTGLGFTLIWISWVAFMISQGFCMYKDGLVYRRKKKVYQSRG
ncbi:hypothetical protein I302_103459 [Kwoniella bestiolae CBS 10118]|uniref:Uncharacterized protein n=1 Tax=Kwoniella bestiolae CBS 10118 TaxID=1296100 RepID=A0A1B9G8G5_9TREE|nr:hypothetical protein I302_02159 [Kwoniella bestiolae CBS 10118]OCF27318.1 hypothetical protein I302_02159 [Kwoniella bestiolae CBS 10118]